MEELGFLPAIVPLIYAKALKAWASLRSLHVKRGWLQAMPTSCFWTGLAIGWQSSIEISMASRSGISGWKKGRFPKRSQSHPLTSQRDFLMLFEGVVPICLHSLALYESFCKWIVVFTGKKQRRTCWLSVCSANPKILSFMLSTTFYVWLFISRAA